MTTLKTNKPVARDQHFGTAKKLLLNIEVDHPGENYGCFPMRTTDMQDGSDQSIDAGTLLLAREIPLSGLLTIPTRVPVLVILEDGRGASMAVATVCFLRNHPDQVCLGFYNPAKASIWLPVKPIKRLFLIEKVFMPDGRHFRPAARVCDHMLAQGLPIYDDTGFGRQQAA